MRSSLIQVSAPATEPVSVSEAKDYLRVDQSNEDGRIGAMITAARIHLEEYLSLKFITQDWDVFLDGWPIGRINDWWDGVRDGSIRELSSQAGEIILPIGRMQQLLAFETFADDNVAVSETVADYIVDTTGNRARIALKTGGVWPTTVLRAVNGIKFRVRVGFGSSASDVPMDIKQAILEYVSHLYENRGDQAKVKAPAYIYTLVEHYRRHKLGC